MLPPVFLNMMPYTQLQNLKTLLVGGDISSLKLIHKWSQGRRLINAYGPTEGTVCASMNKYEKGDLNTNIGKPLDNARLYVLDINLTPVPIGVIGELYIGGAGLARGYLNNEELTAKRFIENPFATDADKKKGYTRLYKTGDLVRWLPDGNLEYIRRNDDQIKIRGYRIELAEIEHALLEVPGIKQCCVMAKEKQSKAGTNKYLVGYYVLDRNHISGKDSDIIHSWENLYDAEYEKTIDKAAIDSDFSGWNSYIIGEPIPLTEMQAWRNDIVNIITSLSPANVLEIGVGSGLLMYPLLKDVQSYVGLDMSQPVINRHKNYLKNKNYKVELVHLKAHQIDQLPQNEFFDTIIVNSVCQYFPGIQYFDDMLDKAIHKLSETGTIFLGDIRNYDLRKELIKEKLDYKGESYTQQDIDRIALKENELLISPSYFINLKNKYENIKVDVLQRGGSYSNELSKYRYDVVISTQNKKIIKNNIEITKDGSDIVLIDSSNHYNIPYLNQLSKEDILDQLSNLLPDYMMPSSLVAMQAFPLTINGKLDKRALPDPDFNLSDEYVAPTTDTEIALCKIWQQVLGLDKVGITDDFFRIGGNSILAIQVSHQMSKLLDCEVKVADVFKYKTPSQLLDHSAGQTQINIPKTNTNTSVLSFAQERLWFIEQYEQGTNAYHMPTVFELDKNTDIAGIKYALTQIVSRHRVLRSTIQQGDNQQGIQIIHDQSLPIEQVSLTDKDDLETLIKEDVNRPFDLSAAYPIRVKFYSIQSEPSETDLPLNRTILLVNIHHIATDGWSTEIFQRELFVCYQAYLNNDTTFSLPALEIQYKDYAAWQRSYLTGEVLEKQLSYWKDKLSEYQTLALPTDYPRPSQVDYKGAYQACTLNKKTSQKLRALAKDYGVTLHSVLLSSINILLGKYTGQQDIVIGSPIANRHYSQTKDLIGFFVNMQVNRTLLSKAQTYEQLIHQVHKEQIAAQLHQDLPFERLVDELDVERDTSRHPVFQVSFVVQSFGKKNNTTDEQKKYFKPFQGSAAYQATKFDLSIYIDDSQQEITGLINYATSLFHKDSIARLIDHYTYLLSQLTEAPQKAYSELSLLRPEQYNQIIYQWNDTDKDYPKDKTIYQLFQQQAEKTPNSTALVYEDQQLNYKQLNEKSNQLARHIRKEYEQRTGQGLGADTLIPLCLDRSMEMVIGILAVLKAGGAYVPIDPSYPQQRINYILEDTQAVLVLTQRLLSQSHDTELPQNKVVYIDLSEKLYQQEDTSNLSPHSKASDLAYIIYTSGTTGKPKGVMVENHQVSSFAIDNNFIDYEKVSVVAGVSNYAFDGSIFDIFFSLINGKKLILIDKNHLLDLSLLDNQFIKYNVDTVFITTALFNSLVSNQSKSLDVLQQILFGGEACNIETVNNFKSRYKKTSLIHVYGPTENIVYASYCNLNGYNTKNAVPIGAHLSDKKLYILDNNLSPVPIGVIGELYIGGAGLARGYLNNKTLTAKRFIPNPFATDTDKKKGYTRLYKTGDLVRWLPDGNLEYIRRNDDQVKIRGYRIEFAEIEHALTQTPGIKQSCVMAKERNTETGTNKYLVGYYVLDRNHVTEKDSDIVHSWENLYNSSVYKKNIDEVNIASDFSGWNSYITEQPIPMDQMKAWRNDIVDILTSLSPYNVLEIGVGSGLLMYPLLKNVQSYVGLDMSQPVINRHKNYLKNKNYKVELVHLKADQIDQLPQNKFFDTIIVNSVCQYFPNIQYFDDMLDKAINKLSQTGAIFLGDIRNYDLHKELIKEKLDYIGESYTQQDIDRMALKENELLISPNYFINLKNKYENIKVDVLQRNGSYSNELSKYRYDVVISTQNKKIIKNNIGITKDVSDLVLTDSTYHYNIPYLNQLSKEDILDQLSNLLPDYMMPSSLVAMEAFPLTINGKLDKRALPDPDFNLSNEYVAPTTDTEIALCKIWQKVLGVDKVSITDNFFRIGGNSILAITVISRINKILSIELTVKELFLNTTIESISSLMQTKTNTENPIVNQVLKDPLIRLSNKENVYYVLENEKARYLEYKSGNIKPMNSIIHKELSDVNQTALSKAVDALVARHESLRTLFLDTDGSVLQKIYPENEFTPNLSLQDICHQKNKKEKLKSIIDKASKHLFDFQNEQSFKCKLIKYEKNKYVFIFTIDHIIYDARSLEIIEEELSILYNAYGKGLPNPLKPLKLQLRHYTSYHLQHHFGDKLAYHQAYFENLFKDIPPKLKIKSNKPSNKKADPNQRFDELGGATITKKSVVRGYAFTISKEISDQIQILTSELKISFFNFMLASYSVFLSKISDQNDFVIDSPTSTRTNEDFSKIIGCLHGILVSRIKVNNDVSFKELLLLSRNVIVEAMDHIYYQNITEELNVEWSASLNVINDMNTAKGEIVDFEPYHYDIEYAYFDITFLVNVFENGIYVRCSHKNDAIDKSEISEICEKFVSVVKMAIGSPNIKMKYWNKVDSTTLF